MGVGSAKKLSVLTRDFFTCKLCNKSPAIDHSIILHVDHIFPISKGGGNDFENLQTLCSECNILKRDKLPYEVDEYFLLKQFRKKHNVKNIFYPAQTKEDRQKRLNNNRCIIHACLMSKKKITDVKDIPVYELRCKRCSYFVHEWNGNIVIHSQFEHLMMGSFCWI